MRAQGRQVLVKGWIGSFYLNLFSLASLTTGLGLPLQMFMIITLLCLEWGLKICSHCWPFKFNRAWLMEEDFAHLVLSSWKAPLDMDDYSHIDVLTLKLHKLKGYVKD